jgi:hypothetical protein
MHPNLRFIEFFGRMATIADDMFLSRFLVSDAWVALVQQSWRGAKCLNSLKQMDTP